MDEEMTLSAIYEHIAERLALARTRALMGERQDAIGLFQAASLEFRRFRDVLRSAPGYAELNESFRITLQHLRGEFAAAQNSAPSGSCSSARRVRKAA